MRGVVTILESLTRQTFGTGLLIVPQKNASIDFNADISPDATSREHFREMAYE